MRFGTIAKILILVFVVSVVFSGLKTCSSRTSGHTYQAAPVAVQQTAQQQTAQGQGQAVMQPLTIQPLVMPPEKMTLTRGNAVLEVFNIPDCSAGDTVPVTPIFTALWNETDIEKLDYYRLAPLTIFETCGLTRVRFFYWSGADGVYAFGIRSTGGEAVKSLRINGQQVVQMTKSTAAVGQAALKTGWYEVDARIYFDRKAYPYWFGYALLHKKPSENQMIILTKNDLYVSKTDTEKLQENKQTEGK